ncbi:MAG: transglutaminase domain-containing protein [Akkermansiaceae bacterium]
MKTILFFLFSAACAIATPTDDFIAKATESHGVFGEKAARFLCEHMSETDKKSLTAEFLTENLNLALKARATFPWAKDVPEEIFLNDVLPYAVFDEPRDPWRADFLEKATPLVKDARTASEAVQILNRDFFKLINTHYNTQRERTNQSPKESIAQGKATCTGLSIILVDVCRAVGIPARAAGTPMWWDKSGNHTWVEVWDNGWHFTGADEFDPKGLNHGWFIVNASKADENHPAHSIYASSWKKDQGIFPMMWSQRNPNVGGVNVTSRYKTKVTSIPTTIGIRFFDGDERISIKGKLTTDSGFPIGDFETKSGTADLNDVARKVVTPGQSYRLYFEIKGKRLETAPFIAKEADRNLQDIRIKDLQPAPDFSDDSKSLSKELAPRAIRYVYDSIVFSEKDERTAELEEKTILQGDKTMRWLEKTFGEAPATGRSLWISMHGGGEAPAHINHQQWQNQIQLYEPEEGIYIAPRAPTDKWNMWHQEHIDPMFARLIENMVALRGVDPNKIYLMGYSAGGDGVWQVAPRMADHFAAASMMAGHPNEASLLGIRNLPFGIFMGANDAAVNRNKVAVEKSAEILELQKADPEGYVHMSRIYPGLPHWMNRKDAEALPWMAKFTRKPWPKKVVWYQDDVTHQRFYWLQIPDGVAAKEQKIIAEIIGQKINLTGDAPKGIQLLLSDELLDLDKAIEITINGQKPITVKAVRSLKAIRDALSKQLDPAITPTAVAVYP